MRTAAIQAVCSRPTLTGWACRLERERRRNIEMIWLTGQLAPDFKTIADFRKDNGKAIREVCRKFGALCRKLDLLSTPTAAAHVKESTLPIGSHTRPMRCSEPVLGGDVDTTSRAD
jgi:Transposase domain (DUF772)